MVRRVVDVPESWRGRVARLRIGGVHRRATAYVNGLSVGDTDIFSAPVAIDITRALRPGASNQIVIRVENPPAPLERIAR